MAAISSVDWNYPAPLSKIALWATHMPPSRGGQAMDMRNEVLQEFFQALCVLFADYGRNAF